MTTRLWSNLVISNAIENMLKERFRDILKYPTSELPVQRSLFQDSPIHIEEENLIWREIYWQSPSFFFLRTNETEISLEVISQANVLVDALIRSLKKLFENAILDEKQFDIVLVCRHPVNKDDEKDVSYFEKNGLLISIARRTQKWDNQLVIRASCALLGFDRFQELTTNRTRSTIGSANDS
jgi:hypothetical protein